MKKFKYEIEKGIEIPEKSLSSIYPFEIMEVGDSFFVDDIKKYEALLSRKAYLFKKFNIKISVRRVDGGIRVWRTL